MEINVSRLTQMKTPMLLMAQIMKTLQSLSVMSLCLPLAASKGS